MNKFKSISFAATSVAALTLTNVQAFASFEDNNVQNLTDSEVSIAGKCLHVATEQPANRDYHTVLSAFDDDNEGDYKFSGCGSAI